MAERSGPGDPGDGAARRGRSGRPCRGGRARRADRARRARRPVHHRACAGDPGRRGGGRLARARAKVPRARWTPRGLRARARRQPGRRSERPAQPRAQRRWRSGLRTSGAAWPPGLVCARWVASRSCRRSRTSPSSPRRHLVTTTPTAGPDRPATEPTFAERALGAPPNPLDNIDHVFRHTARRTWLGVLGLALLLTAGVVWTAVARAEGGRGCLGRSRAGGRHLHRGRSAGRARSPGERCPRPVRRSKARCSPACRWPRPGASSRSAAPSTAGCWRSTYAPGRARPLAPRCSGSSRPASLS